MRTHIFQSLPVLLSLPELTYGGLPYDDGVSVAIPSQVLPGVYMFKQPECRECCV
jgi:hypothetical protein